MVRSLNPPFKTFLKGSQAAPNPYTLNALPIQFISFAFLEIRSTVLPNFAICAISPNSGIADTTSSPAFNAAEPAVPQKPLPRSISAAVLKPVPANPATAPPTEPHGPNHPAIAPLKSSAIAVSSFLSAPGRLFQSKSPFSSKI